MRASRRVLFRRAAAFTAALVAAILPAFGTPARADTIVVPARELSDKSPNIKPVDERWDGLVVCYGERGMQQWTVDVETPGPHYVHLQYASGEPRPVKLSINGTPSDTPVLGQNTGGFFARHLKWEVAGPFELRKGENTIRIETEGLMPHPAGLVVSESAKNLDERAFAKLFPEPPEVVLAIDEDTAAARAKLRRLLPGVEHVLFVRRYTFQSSHYYTDFIDGCRRFGGNLCLLSLKDGSVRDLVPELSHGIFGRCDLSYDAQRVVFGWKEKIGVGFRIWEVGIDGSGLRQLTCPPPDEDARIAKYRLDWWKTYWHHTDDMHPCYLPDGGICFASTRCQYGILCDGPDKLTSSVLYRMNGDGSGIEKLSNNSVSESAPSVMSDGRILYTRWEYVDKGTVTNKGLWAVRPDGTGTEEICGMNVAFPSVFNVGRAVPGSNHLFVAIGAPHMPLGVGTVLRIDARLDRRTGQGVSYFTPEVDARHQWGWDNVPGGATRPIPPEEQAGRDGRGNTRRGPLYMDPYPLSETHLLVSFNPREEWNVENAYGLYLIDERGNKCLSEKGSDPLDSRGLTPFRIGSKSLLHKEDEFSCWMPIPVRPREKPAVPRATIDPELARQGLARLVVTDVYRGLDGVKPGTIRYLRINEHVPRPWAARRCWEGDEYDQQHSTISRNAHLGLKIQHGVVPVEADGSAHFLVQADRNIFLQALDADYTEVQRERTFVNYRPGEVRSCVGCHERPREGNRVATCALPLAAARPPSLPGPQPGETTGARPLSYEVDVQPVWDRHCVSCHGPEKMEARLDLSGQRTQLFNRSYENIMSRGLVAIIGENHPKAGNAHYLPPYSLGTHASRLRAYLGKDHYDVALSPAERIHVTTWIDSNAQYYGSYYGRKNLQYADHPNFRPVLTFEQSQANVPPWAEELR